MQLQAFVQDDVFSPALVANELRTSKAEIARTLGLGKDAFTRAGRVRARKTQTRLRQMLEVLNRVEAETGSSLAAYAWFVARVFPASAARRRTSWCGKARASMYTPIWIA